jgi:hypothetical protein
MESRRRVTLCPARPFSARLPFRRNYPRQVMESSPLAAGILLVRICAVGAGPTRVPTATGRRPRSCSRKLPSLCIPGGSPTRGDDAPSDLRSTQSSRGPPSAEAAAGDRRHGIRERSAAKAFAASRHRANLPAEEESRSAGDPGRSIPAALQKAVDRGAHQRLAGKLPTLGRAL